MERLRVELGNFRSFAGDAVELEFLRGAFTGLVGSNNTGKSSLLRFFWELRPTFTSLATTLRQVGSVHAKALVGGDVSPLTLQTLAGERIFCTANDADCTIGLQFEESPYQANDDLWPSSAKLTLHRSSSQLSLRIVMGDGEVLSGPAGGVANLRSPGDRLPTYQVGSRAVDLTPLIDQMDLLSKSMYVGPFRNAINVGANSSYFDLAIGDKFISQLAAMKSGPNPDANEAVYKMTQDVARIFKFSDLEVNPSPDGQSLQIMVNGKSYRGSEMGGGLTHFLLLAATVLERHPTLLLIDEPELNLHPALQVDFLTLIGSYAEFSVGFATHSLGLARTTADRLYVVNRSENEISTCEPYESASDLPSLAGQMGYSGFNDFQYDGILLVEGVTDVRTFLQLLRLYGREHRYAIVPLGGQDFLKRDVGVEVAELARLSNRIVAVLDSEKDEPGQPVDPGRLAFADALKEVGGVCHILERRSIESYFPDRAVKTVYGPQGRALGPWESTKTAGFGWNKRRNWQVARQIAVKDLDGTDLGAILASL